MAQMNITIQKERNDIARKEIETVSKEYGIRLGFIAKQLNMQLSSFSHWRKEKYEFGENKLNEIESLINKYNNMS